MLVLSRRCNESIMIGDEIEVTVVEVQGDQVKLGINAPRQVAVHRKEIYEAIQLANIQAAQTQVQSVGDLAAAFRGTPALPDAAPPEAERNGPKQS